jgi:predicted RecB family nuclease
MLWLLYAKSAAVSIFKSAAAYPWQVALIASLCLSLWLYSGKQHARAIIAKKDDTIVQMEVASKIATAVQIELNKQVTDKQTKIARMIDNDETNRRNIADRSRAYAGRMSAQSYCRKASLAPENHFTPSSNSASGDAVVVSQADFNILTRNTARLVDVKAWADRLIGEGLAVSLE